MTGPTPCPPASDGGEYCPFFQHALELIGRRWSGSIVKVLDSTQLRFSEIRDRIPGLSDRLLNDRLTELTDEGIVERLGTDRSVRYRLSEKGRDLLPVFDALAEWSTEHHVGELTAQPGRRRTC